jgi:serine/threonine-protein kinase
MVARTHPSGGPPKEVAAALDSLWDLAARANRLEGEVASHTRKLEALERRGRALRAEIGRKVEELAQDESRSLREASALAEEEEAARVAVVRAEHRAEQALQAARREEQRGRVTREIFVQLGAAQAMVEAKRDWLQTRRAKRDQREAVARDLRAQIEELRGQLARYAEALEEELQSGRDKVARRAREGLEYERAYQEAASILLAHLKGKPECRDLMNELMAEGSIMAAQSPRYGASATRGSSP